VSQFVSNSPSALADWLVAIGTIGAVIVALFGQLLPRLLPPKLRIKLLDTGGVRQLSHIIQHGGALPVPIGQMWTRYYHVHVSNSRRWTKARTVQVVFLKSEEETTTGWVEVSIGSGIPLTWQHQYSAGSNRNVGRPAVADLFRVGQDASNATLATSLSITPTFAPFGVPTEFNQPCALRLTVQAQSDEADSDPITLTIRSNGKWHDGKAEMMRFVSVVQEV